MRVEEQKAEIEKAIEVVRTWDSGVVETEEAEMVANIGLEEGSDNTEREVQEMRDIIKKNVI